MRTTVFLALSGALPLLVGCGANITAYPAPRGPVTSLDPLESGETELSLGATNTVVLEEQLGLLPVDWTTGFGVPLSGALAQGVGPVELRVSAGLTGQSTMWGGGVGLRSPRFGRWVAVADVGYARTKVVDKVPVQQDTGEYAVEKDAYDSYGYTVAAPNARLRLVWQPWERVQVPLALRATHSSTEILWGLEDHRNQEQTYLDLSVGVIWEPGPGCMQYGTGLSIDPRYSQMFLVQASISCQFSIAKLRGAQ